MCRQSRARSTGREAKYTIPRGASWLAVQETALPSKIRLEQFQHLFLLLSLGARRKSRPLAYIDFVTHAIFDIFISARVLYRRAVFRHCASIIITKRRRNKK